MANEINQLRKKSNDFVSKLDTYIEIVIEDSEVELTSLNRDQMLSSRTATDQAITPPYSQKYATFKGKSNPDLFLTGDFQKEMVIQTNGSQYNISSLDEKTASLVSRYGEEIFGVAPSNQDKAKKVTTEKLTDQFRANVL